VTDVWRRHDLLRIDPPGWRLALSLRSDLRCLDLLSDWADRGWPVMVRRYLPSDLPDRIPVAVALPRSVGKGGVALQVRPRDVMTCLAPVLLDEAAPVAPVRWKPALQQLLTVGKRFGSVPAVYGSVLWQRLTGIAYLHEHSDLDLIWQVTHAAQAQQLAAAIDACAAQSPMAIDGEFIFAQGSAVNWREFHQPGRQVLAKTLHGVEMIERQRLFRAGVELGSSL
jgi:phosphoribosyl-dephospho-CoA transferase